MRKISKDSTAPAAEDVAAIELLLQELEQHLEQPHLSMKRNVEQQSSLDRLKVLGRNPEISGAIFSERGVAILCRYALDQPEPAVSREALKCLANALLLNESSRQTFVDLGYAPKAAERLKNDHHDDEFLVSRILFLITYGTKVDFEPLVERQLLAQSINDHISSHAKNFSESGRRKSVNSQMQDMAMTETLKLLFNITYYFPALIPKFTPAVEPIISILNHIPLPYPPLQPPVTNIINALLNLDLVGSEKQAQTEIESVSVPLLSSSSSKLVVSRLATIFDYATRSQIDSSLDQAGAAPCTLLRRMYSLAMPETKTWMQSIFLPKPEDRDKPLGQGDTLSARLLRLSCSPKVPTLRENISNFLFELSDKDANRFVRNIGYGFASGFLMSHNIEIPTSVAEAESSRAANVEGGTMINPVTGQILDAEERDAPRVGEMSLEEKEKEAERLFVLFERLKATGVVDIQNPVQQAIDEGRFEELPG